MHESENWKGSHLVVSDSSWPHGLQPTRLPCPWDFPGKSTTGVGCHCLLWNTIYNPLKKSWFCSEYQVWSTQEIIQWNKKICGYCILFLISFLSRFAPVSYNRDSDQLTKWLESSQQTLNYWKEQSLNVSQDLDTIRSNINNFFVSCNRICLNNYWLAVNNRGKLWELMCFVSITFMCG